jgi:hypothetical protein
MTFVRSPAGEFGTTHSEHGSNKRLLQLQTKAIHKGPKYQSFDLRAQDSQHFATSAHWCG